MKPQVADPQYRTFCVRIVPLSGATVRLTAHPRSLSMSNGQAYLSESGYEFTGLASSANLSPGVIDLEGIAGMAGVGRDEIASGVFDNARCYLFATNWTAPVEDEEPLGLCFFGKTTLADERYRVELMGLADALNQSTGKTVTPGCPKTFGGQEYAGCKKDLVPLTVSGTITHVTSASIFRDSARAEAADYFGVGTIKFTSGANAALRPQQIKRHEADGTLETYEPFYYAVAVGDAYTMIPGCRKRLTADCFTKWNNVVNFGGFPHVPTQSQYAQIGDK